MPQAQKKSLQKKTPKGFRPLRRATCPPPRKAAEQGGVHPIHIDQISSDFAKKIEDLTMSTDRRGLMLEMFRTYTRLVRSHSQKIFLPSSKKPFLPSMRTFPPICLPEHWRKIKVSAWVIFRQFLKRIWDNHSRHTFDAEEWNMPHICSKLRRFKYKP